MEIGVNGGFASPNDNPLIGPDVCTIYRMQGRLTCAIVNHNQVTLQALSSSASKKGQD